MEGTFSLGQDQDICSQNLRTPDNDVEFSGFSEVELHLIAGNVDNAFQLVSRGHHWGLGSIFYLVKIDNSVYLEWAFDHGVPYEPEHHNPVIHSAALRNLSWLLRNKKISHSEILSVSLSLGRLDILQLSRFEGMYWKKDDCLPGLYHRQFHVVLWCMQDGCPYSDSVLQLAAALGIQPILEHAVKQGTHKNSAAAADAFHAGHLDLYQWMVENEFEPYHQARELVAKEINTFTNPFKLSQLVADNDLDAILAIYHADSSPRHIQTAHICGLALAYGKREIFDWAMSTRHRCGAESVMKAFKNGHYELVRHAINCGAPYRKELVKDAARLGKKDIIESILQYGLQHVHGCATIALRHGHTEIFQLLKNHGARYDVSIARRRIKYI